ncbi:hypothetical protein BJY00DRAFT_124563 [Aspergillus carlsbadensis]|nr:hypothetical protein BJY00DRAFT_124563 [Aspergillus carlsbadensis]
MFIHIPSRPKSINRYITNEIVVVIVQMNGGRTTQGWMALCHLLQEWETRQSLSYNINTG